MTERTCSLSFRGSEAAAETRGPLWPEGREGSALPGGPECEEAERPARASGGTFGTWPNMSLQDPAWGLGKKSRATRGRGLGEPSPGAWLLRQEGSLGGTLAPTGLPPGRSRVVGNQGRSWGFTYLHAPGEVPSLSASLATLGATRRAWHFLLDDRVSLLFPALLS